MKRKGEKGRAGVAWSGDGLALNIFWRQDSAASADGFSPPLGGAGSCQQVALVQAAVPAESSCTCPSTALTKAPTKRVFHQPASAPQVPGPLKASSALGDASIWSFSLSARDTSSQRGRIRVAKAARSCLACFWGRPHNQTWTNRRGHGQTRGSVERFDGSRDSDLFRVFDQFLSGCRSSQDMSMLPRWGTYRRSRSVFNGETFIFHGIDMPRLAWETGLDNRNDWAGSLGWKRIFTETIYVRYLGRVNSIAACGPPRHPPLGRSAA